MLTRGERPHPERRWRSDPRSPDTFLGTIPSSCLKS